MDVEGSAFENDMAADAGPAGAGSPSHITCSSSALSPSKSNPPMTHNDGPCNGSNKRKRRPAGTPDPDAEVVALSPRTLLESDRYICDICSQGFQRDQNLQMHRRRHKVPWKLLKRQTTDTRKRVYVCPEPTCLHHDPSHALGDLVGIKKHYRRKHSTDKQWKCEKCSKGYAVQSDYKAHLKTCGTRGHCCDCGRVFSRVESFIEHQDTCTAAKEKSALQIGGLVGGSQANRGLADSPSSRSLSTECLSVDPSRSALSDSAVMPSCSEYGDMPVNSSSPSGNQQHWMMLGDSRELQLLPEESGGSRGATSMMVMSSTSGGRRVIPVIELKCNTPPTAQSAGGSGGGGGGGGGGGAETTPGLQLSIGPYSNTEDASNLRDKASISMIGPSLPDVYEVKPVTATERAAFSSMQQHRLQRRASEGSNSEVNTAVAGLGALQSLTSASLRGGGGGGSGSALGGGGLGSSVGHNGCGGIGDGLTLSSSSPPTTATSCARGGGGECSDVAQMHHLLKGPAGARKNVSSNLLLAGVKESSLLSRRRSRSPNQYQQYDMHNGQSDLVVVPASTECMGGAWGQANRQQNAPLTPTTPSTTNGGTYVTDLESETAIMPMRNRQYGGGGGGGAAAREHMEAALRAMEEASRHKDMASNAREMARPDVGSAWWTDLAAARRTKEQARVEREEAESQLAQAELLKQEAREQMKLASAEKTYAEHARENAKRQRELAESELNSAKRVREQAQSDFAKAQMLKEQADRFMDAASGRLSVAAVMSNQPSTDASSSAQSEQQQQNNNNNNSVSGSSSSSKNNQRQVPPCLDFTSLPLPNFSSTSSPFQISTPPRYPSSMIPVTFIGTSAICPPPMSLPPSFDTVCTTAASHSTYSSSMVTEGHLRTPKPEMI